MRRGTLVLSLLIVALAAFPAGAGATVTFGANLAREPDNAAPNCLTAQSTYPFVFYDANCSIQSNDPTTGESSFPPTGEGVVSLFRVKVGATTGPMQIAEEEALRKENPAEPGKPTYACCKLVGLSQVFTPAPNAITEVPVSFHVKQDIAPEESGYYVDDHFSLSVLDKEVPIPLAEDPNAGVGIWFPAWQTVGEERASTYGTCCGMVLFNGDWNAVEGAAPNGAGANAPPGPVVTPPAPVQQLPLAFPAFANVRNNRALLPLACNLSQACRGLLRLQNARAGGAARLLARSGGKRARRQGKRRRRTITYAAAAFKIPAGKKRTLRAKLKAAGKRLLKHHPKAKVWVNVTLKGTSETVPSRKLTLKLAGGKKKKG